MAKITFAARIIRDRGETKSTYRVPQRVAQPDAAVLVENPFTGHDLWLAAGDVVNRVNGVATVLLEAAPSGRFPSSPPKRGFREFINPNTGNTFQVSLRAIIKENA